jgi:nucleoid DNA-binding protein
MSKVELPKEIIEEIATLYNLPTHVVERIVRHQFKYAKECLANDKTIRLHKLGVFAPKALINGYNKGS